MTTSYPMYSYPVRPEMTAQERRVAALDRAFKYFGSHSVDAAELVKVAGMFEKYIEKGSS